MTTRSLGEAPTSAGVAETLHGEVRRSTASTLRRLLVETLVMLALLGAYDGARALINGQAARAFRNARALWSWERAVGLPDELHVQHALLRFPGVAHAANVYYASVHFPLTAMVLLWLFLRHPALHAWTRNTLVLATAASLVLESLVPLAPPRMMTGLGFVDVAARYGPAVYGSPGHDLANQYAAMPSLHVGWAVLIAVAMIRALPSRRRWLWLAHPVITLVVVIGTGNHYLADAVVGTTIITAAGGLVAAVDAQRRRSTTAGGPAAVEVI